VDLQSLAPTPTEGVALNDIARVTLRSHAPLFLDAYGKNRSTGAFILVDSLTNDTVAAGMVVDDRASTTAATDRGSEGLALRSQVSERERAERLGHDGAVVAVQDHASAAGLELAAALALAYAAE